MDKSKRNNLYKAHKMYTSGEYSFSWKYYRWLNKKRGGDLTIMEFLSYEDGKVREVRGE